MAYDITLEGQNLIEAESLLKEAAALFHKHKIAYWLEGGTLLGIIREDRLLPWDNDLDFSMMCDQLNLVNALLEDLKRKGFRVRIRRFEEDSEQFKKGDIRMLKIRRKKFFGLIKGNVCLDIFVKYPHEDKAYWEIANRLKHVPLHFYQQFREIQFKGSTYMIPKETEAYLTYRYGDWKIQKKDWDTSRDDQALA
ncbi:MAG: LicD family protein [Eudoraea sp.]|nr:LicD family protein [Eudoraea sp.]